MSEKKVTPIPVCKCGHDMLRHMWAIYENESPCKECDCEEFEAQR